MVKKCWVKSKILFLRKNETFFKLHRINVWDVSNEIAFMRFVLNHSMTVNIIGRNNLTEFLWRRHLVIENVKIFKIFISFSLQKFPQSFVFIWKCEMVLCDNIGYIYWLSRERMYIFFELYFRHGLRVTGKRKTKNSFTSYQ